MATVEASRPEDVAAVRRIAEAVFKEYGAYGRLLPRFFASQGVATFVARLAGTTVGFVMMGFLPWQGGEGQTGGWIGDLLAIAVDPAHQRKGIGSQLMQQGLELACRMSEWRDLREIQLTCAADNRAALRFFARHGFQVRQERHGSYAGGQAAMRLARPFP